MAGGVRNFLGMYGFWEIILAICGNGAVKIFSVRFRCMNTLELVLKFERRLIIFFLDFSAGCLNTFWQHPPGGLWEISIW